MVRPRGFEPLTFCSGGKRRRTISNLAPLGTIPNNCALLLVIKDFGEQCGLQRMPPPYVTRLVKLLYLADLEWRRTHKGEPIANLTWKFLHFGPYANELADLLGGPELEVTELEQGKDARRFTFGKETEKSGLPSEIVGLLNQLVKKWGDVQLNKLLDYVYFDTEPMENAKRYELLDFSGLTPSPH